jgi:hypothetical protein
METLVPIVLALTALALQDPAAPKPRAVVHQEHFVLEVAVAEEPGASRAVGLAVCRRQVEGRREQLEWEIRFHESGVADTRVLHVERLERGQHKLIWRAWRPGAGRTLIVDWAGEEAPLRVLEWGRSETLREEIAAEPGAILPLGLQELARRAHTAAPTGGGFIGSRYRWFDPMSRRFETVRVRRTVEASAPLAGVDTPPCESRVELRREDDTLAAAWVFDAEGLRAFRWQEGGVRGRRITAQDYRGRLRDILTDR